MGSLLRWVRAGRILFLTETAVTVKKGCWSAGSKKDEVSFEALLVDDGAPPSREARMEPSDCGSRNLDFDQRVHHQRGIDSHQELFKTGALKRRDGNCFAIAGEVGEFLGRDEIDLVQDLDDGLVRNSKLAQDFFNLSSSALRAWGWLRPGRGEELQLARPLQGWRGSW